MNFFALWSQYGRTWSKYSCDVLCLCAGGRLQPMAQIGGDVDKQAVAILRRAENGFEDAVVADGTRLCFNCNQSIRNELEMVQNNPMCLRLNVVKQRRNRACLFCFAV